MKSYQVVLLSLFLVLFSSCEVIAGIFEAGVWVGVLIIVAIVALVVWLLRRFTGRR